MESDPLTDPATSARDSIGAPLDPEGEPTVGNSTVSLATECDYPGCTWCGIGRYCRRHSSNPTTGSSGIDTGGLETLNTRDPSRRELQRQMDRLEGKLDALLAALELDVDE